MWSPYQEVGVINSRHCMHGYVIQLLNQVVQRSGTQPVLLDQNNVMCFKKLSYVLSLARPVAFDVQRSHHEIFFRFHAVLCFLWENYQVDAS